MATAAQTLANQVNAQLSTGPHLIVREDEKEEFASFSSDLLTELAPQGAIEILTFNELLHAAWNPPPLPPPRVRSRPRR